MIDRLSPLALALTAPLASAQEPPHSQVAAERILSFLHVVEVEHVDPPTRRQMLAAAVDRLGTHVEANLADWKERIPPEGDDEATEAFLRGLHEAGSGLRESNQIGNEMVRGILVSLPGDAYTVDPDTAKVNDSLIANQYVGVGIVFAFEDGRPVIRDMYWGGPAHRGGIEVGDVVYEVDGHDTFGMASGSFLGYSRGDVGTEFVYVVGKPGSDERETIALTRDVVPRETVEGVARGADEAWAFELEDSGVAYAKLTDINASTAHELRRAAERMRRDGLRGVVLDLRRLHGRHMQPAALVADLFRTDGVMGISETRWGRTEYRARPDALFDPAGIVVLVDSYTSGTAEWLATVIRDAGGVVVGERTEGHPWLPGRVQIPGWPSQVNMSTGQILDRDGRGPMKALRPHVAVEDDDAAIEVALALLRAV